jgi:hypothetical protein
MQVVVPLMQFTLLFNLLTLFLKCYLLSSFNSDVVKMFVLSCCLDPFEQVSCARVLSFGATVLFQDLLYED